MDRRKKEGMEGGREGRRKRREGGRDLRLSLRKFPLSRRLDIYALT